MGVSLNNLLHLDYSYMLKQLNQISTVFENFLKILSQNCPMLQRSDCKDGSFGSIFNELLEISAILPKNSLNPKCQKMISSKILPKRGGMKW